MHNFNAHFNELPGTWVLLNFQSNYLCVYLLIIINCVIMINAQYFVIVFMYV